MVNILDMQVGIFAKTHAVVANYNETIAYTFQLMVKYNIRHVSIIDDQLSLVGILTANHILKAMLKSENTQFLHQKNHELMKRDVYFVSGTDTLRDTIITMNRSNLSAIPVLVDRSIDGIFTDKDILYLDQLWRDIPDLTITKDRGIGKTITEKDIVPHDFTLVDAAKHVLSTKRNFLLIEDNDNNFSGVVSVNKILGSIIPLLMFGGSNMNFLKRMNIASIVNEPILRKKSPTLVMPTRMLMKSKGLGAVLLFENEKPVKFITQIDIINHLVDTYLVH